MRWLAIAACLIPMACSNSIEQYQDNTPTLVLEEFFQGHLVVHGLVKNRRGAVTRHFSATIDARWQGDVGWLDEHFLFDNGERHSRCWQLQKTPSGYLGSAGDVVGQAQGVVAGNTLHWVYQLLVPVSGKTWSITLDDWLYLVDENNLINTTKMKKWGVTVGELVLSIRRTSAPAQGNFASCPGPQAE